MRLAHHRRHSNQPAFLTTEPGDSGEWQRYLPHGGECMTAKMQGWRGPAVRRIGVEQQNQALQATQQSAAAD